MILSRMLFEESEELLKLRVDVGQNALDDGLHLELVWEGNLWDHFLLFFLVFPCLFFAHRLVFVAFCVLPGLVHQLHHLSYCFLLILLHHELGHVLPMRP